MFGKFDVDDEESRRRFGGESNKLQKFVPRNEQRLSPSPIGALVDVEKHEAFIVRARGIEPVLPKPNGPVRGSRFRSGQPRHIRTCNMKNDGRDDSDQ